MVCLYAGLLTNDVHDWFRHMALFHQWGTHVYQSGAQMHRIVSGMM